MTSHLWHDISVNLCWGIAYHRLTYACTRPAGTPPYPYFLVFCHGHGDLVILSFSFCSMPCSISPKTTKNTCHINTHPLPCFQLASSVLLVSSANVWCKCLSFSALVCDLLLRGGQGFCPNTHCQKSISFHNRHVHCLDHTETVWCYYYSSGGAPFFGRGCSPPASSSDEVGYLPPKKESAHPGTRSLS